ncbi:MAG: NADPH-dependent F420 reductase [Chloroflexi bacterium]|nr:MAG: NADPH-dependent F420 reductase [Chloroflexota bacterium]MBL1195964.1 NADPH-dependent F420 reductase [Chloroflexota bacterium]NOH13258.1 NADPH-dependent F420 reductase [Chloroflexota bacterium]
MIPSITDVKTIAILGGTGKIGPGLAMRWAQAGYQIIIGSRTEDKAVGIAAEINEKLGIDSILGLENADAIQRADICVLTVVQSAHEVALTSLKDALQGKVMVDATARVEFKDPRPPQQPSAARAAQTILGDGAKVVAAYQNVPASALKKNLDQPVNADVLVCSDDVAAAELVVQLTEKAGMNGYYAGGLDNAVVVEGLTAILISMNKHYRGHSGKIQVAGIDKSAE